MDAKIINSLTNTIDIEIEELQNLRGRINEQYVDAVQLISKCSGKVVVSGIGKSAQVANKFVATLNSTGTNAQFLHAAEAIHGDLGLLNEEDVVVVISNSGNSPEIKTIAPLLKQYAKALIAITGNLESDLAKYADCVLDSSVEKEACINGLAPTSSTMVQMAICDALSVAVMQEKGFSSEDFAKNHPGGTLGIKLTTKVKDLVNTNFKPRVKETDDAKEAVLSLSSSPYGITVVFNDSDAIVGVITDGDLRRFISKHSDDFMHFTSKEMSSPNPKTIQKESLATEASIVFQENDIGQIVVLDKDEYYGILDIHELLDAGIL